MPLNPRSLEATSTMATVASSKPPENDNKPTSMKPIIVLISPHEVSGFQRRYAKLLLKLRREACLFRVHNSDTLDATIRQHDDDIQAFIVTDAAIMEPPHEALTHRLAAILALPFNEWAIIFAFDFACQAASKPTAFAAYMKRCFQMDWKISGVTSGKIKSDLQWRSLAKMGSRDYRWHYEMRAVFLKSVTQEDKVLVAKGLEKNEDNGDDCFKEGNEDVVLDDHAAAEEDELTYVSGQNSDRSSSDGNEGVAISDCPVAWREIRRDDDEYPSAIGYLGFVGHVGDETQLAGVILGMCAIDSERVKL